LVVVVLMVVVVATAASSSSTHETLQVRLLLHLHISAKRIKGKIL
jgi:hypothetical protein